MPIHLIKQDRFQAVGKIRLGIRKKGQNNNEYPSNVPYFVLDDAPDVERVYGKNPKIIHGTFVSNDLEENIPHSLRLYGAGRKDSSGNMIGGKLKCSGTGTHPDGSAGTAEHFENKDKATGIAPTIECLGVDKCPMSLNAKGEPQCKWAMNVFLYMPHCNPTGVFQIDTTSKVTITNFVQALMTLQKLNKGKLSGFPYALWREEKSMTVPTTGKQTTQYVMNIKVAHQDNEISKFLGEGTINQMRTLSESNMFNIELPSSKGLEGVTMEDNYPVRIGGESQQSLPPVQDKNFIADQILADAEVKGLFDNLEKVTGKKFADNLRKMSILKKINEPDPKAAVLEQLNAEIAKQSQPQPSKKQPAEKKVKPKQGFAPPETAPAEEPPLEVEASEPPPPPEPVAESNEPPSPPEPPMDDMGII